MDTLIKPSDEFSSEKVRKILLFLCMSENTVSLFTMPPMIIALNSIYSRFWK